MQSLAAAVFVPAALGHSSATPPLIGNSKAGKAVFLPTCGACHALKAAGTQGQIGPNLDKVTPLTQALLIKAITNGGSSIMTKAQIAKYTTQMQPYKYLGTKSIQNISRYVYESHKM